MFSRQASVQIENLQEQLQAIAAQRDRAVMDLASSQEQADQYQTSLNNLQLVLEQFQRGRIIWTRVSCRALLLFSDCLVFLVFRARVTAQRSSGTSTERGGQGLGPSQRITTQGKSVEGE